MKDRKSKVLILLILLSILPIFIVSSRVNAATKNTVTLNHSSFIYNKKGKRIKNTRTLKNKATISVAGKIKPTTEKAMYFFYKKDKPWQLNQHLIKKQRYYALGHGQYIKAINVSKVNGQQVFSNKKTTYIIPKENTYLLDKYFNSTNDKVKKGQKIKVNALFSDGRGDLTLYYFRLVGKKDRFLSYDYIEPDDSDPYVRTQLVCKTYNELYNSFINFKHDDQTPLYNVNAQPISIKGYLLQWPEEQQLPEPDFLIDSAWYLWNAKENKAELYYHLKNSAYDSSKAEYVKGNLFVKASEVLVAGIKLKPMNSPEEAKSDSVVAGDEQKKDLQRLVSQAPKVRTSIKYRFSDKEKKQNYDDVVGYAQQAIENKDATVLEIKSLYYWLLELQNNLKGAKVKVKDLKHLTAIEAQKVATVMINDNELTPNYRDVVVHQKTKKGKISSYNCLNADVLWNAKRDPKFILRITGKPNKTLNIADYAVEK